MKKLAILALLGAAAAGAAAVCTKLVRDRQAQQEDDYTECPCGECDECCESEEQPAEQTRILHDIKNVIPMPQRRRAADEAEKAAMEASATAEEPVSTSGQAAEDVVIEDLWDDEEENTPNHMMIEAKTSEEGLKIAFETLASGAARAKLDEFCNYTRKLNS